MTTGTETESDAAIEPDDDTMYRWLCWWFARCNRGAIELAWIHVATGKLSLFRRFALDDLVAAVRFAAQTNARPGCSMYFRPATVKPDTHFTTDADVVQIPGCWVDCDTEDAIDRVLAASLMPSAEIVTGRSPALRAQFTWKLSGEPILVPEWSRELNCRAQSLAGSDASVNNPSTLLRLPGSIAWPHKPGRVVELTEWVTPDGGGDTVSLDTLRSTLPEILRQEPSSTDNSADTTGHLLNPIQALLDQARAGPLWHNPVLRAIAMMVARGFPDWAILNMAEHITWPEYTVTQTRHELAVMIAGARRKGFNEIDVDEVMDVPPKPSPEQPSLDIWDAGQDDYVIAPREWLLGTVFCKRFLSSLIADGGVGKTALRIAQILSLVTGRSLTGEYVFHRCRALFVSLEDDRDELRRRIHASMLKYGIRSEDLKGWLFLAAPKGLKLARMVEGTPQAGALEELLREAITTLRLDLVCLDPFVKTHSVGENDNNAIDFVCELLATIAIDLNCAIDFPHHTNKGSASAGDANKGRGASAAKDAARLVFTLTPMTPEDAARFALGEPERRSLVRFDPGKVNIAPPAADAKWFRLVGHRLGNGTAEYPNGDEVQAVEPWLPPDTWADLDHPLLNRILDDIEAGMPDGQRYSAANAAGRRAAWLVVQKHCPGKPEISCRSVITAWVKSGALFDEEYHDPVQRKDRIGLRVNPNKRPS